MKVIAAPALAALQAGTAIVSAAVWIDAADPLFVWGGDGPLTLDGHEFIGVGDAGLVTTTAGSVGSAAQGSTLRLSRIPPEHLPEIDVAGLRGAPVVIYRLIFDGSGTQLLDAGVHVRGRVDRASIEETPGGEAVITVEVEGSARGLGRRSARMRTDADQRLVNPADGGLKRVAYAGSVTLYLGGKPPAAAGQALPGTTYGGGTVGGKLLDAVSS